jgi:hypothetical protein
MGFGRRTWFAGRSTQAFLLAVLISGLSAQVSESRPYVGVPEDWSHHRIKFSAAILRQHPELASREPRAAMQLYREAFKEARAALDRKLLASETPTASAGTAAPHRDWSISLGSGRIQFGQYPAKWQSDPTLLPSCTTDYVIYGLNVSGVTGAGGQPSLVGLINLYASAVGNPLCGGAQPLFRFSYNTNTTPAAAQGRIRTSPVLSLDGTKVAFIETSTVAGQRTSVLHVLKVPTTGSQALVTPVVAPPAGAMLNATLGDASNTRSSPWIDYASDTLYVGLDNGRLYKVTGVFKGTPTPVVAAPWPILINNNSVLTSPLLDSVSGNLFIGAGNGRLYTVNVTTPGVVNAIQVGRNGGLNPGIYDSPMFDATAGTLFAVTSNDSVLTGASVVQINASTFGIVTRVLIGEGSSAGVSVNLYDGDFDNNYFNSVPTGHMLVCGTGSADTTPNRYLLGFDSGGVLQPGSAVPISGNGNARCGPVTEFFNSHVGGGTDFFFWGVTRNCPAFGANGCVMALANGATLTSAQEVGGTSGIVIDNNYVTKTGGSSIHFSTGAAPNNAVKLTQQGLQ